MRDTLEDYQQIVQICKEIFTKKNRDYGASWRIQRLPTLTDQIYIKAMRIRTIQEKGLQKIEDKPEDEFLGIINYCIIALIQFRLGNGQEKIELSTEDLENLYADEVEKTKQLLQNKNHDYGEAWRDMRISSMTDLILTKLLRIKQIEDNNGNTLISEGVDANYRDILNYAVFCLIKSNFLPDENNE